MLRQFDRYFAARVIAPLLPLIVYFGRGGPNEMKPEFFGGIAIVLGGRLFAESVLENVKLKELTQILCGILPILFGTLVIAAPDPYPSPWAVGIGAYFLATIGTFVAVVLQMRARR